ncbi:MAG: phospho-sugar mutase [Odoribacteraceae bacterium]|jgi:phosphoglucomutase|nr:phospho-sugar mutase [Odoribacteraceae bacterium]
MKTTDLITIAREKASAWLDEAYDDDTRREVQRMLDDDNTAPLVDAFYKDLEFGTGGLRGITGAGTNRVNAYTIGTATQGFARYINRRFAGQPRSACVGHDCRHGSRHFAETVASIFSANGIEVYLFESLRPTPEISFAIRELGCKAGVIITASHNPREYNGYKAYGEDGAQFVPPRDADLLREIENTRVADIRFQRDPALVRPLGDGMDRLYLERVRQLRLNPGAPRAARDLNIVFTPLHGTTYRLVPASLRLWGFTGVHAVPAQETPDGDFPTVATANPEDPAAFKMAIDVARDVNANLVMACDPDGDRVGFVVKNSHGEWVYLDGNQAYVIFLEYIIRGKRAAGQLPADAYIVKTIVTTELARDIAVANGIACHDVYTGFKWIADAIRRHGPDGYIAGGEESFGFMPGTFTRDKDGVAAASLMAEIAAWCKINGSSIHEFLEEIHVTRGYSRERLVQVTRHGAAGAREINDMMKRLRDTPPSRVNDVDVTLVKDYLTRQTLDPRDGTRAAIDVDTPADVLQLYLADGSKISARPSGTEPKIKFYFETRVPARDRDDLPRARAVADRRVDAMIAAIVPPAADTPTPGR